MVHDLKTWREFFDDVRLMVKPFEVRKDDRGYKVGDVLYLREWDRKKSEYTARECHRLVTYILRDPEFVRDGYCIMGLKFL